MSMLEDVSNLKNVLHINRSPSFGFEKISDSENTSYTETIIPKPWVETTSLQSPTIYSQSRTKPEIIEESEIKRLWMSLIGIFESGNPNFAEEHDRVYD